MNNSTASIRRRFLQYFVSQAHAAIPSASLVPENDPTVLFTTAGMHPLVPFLLGQPHPQGKRLADAQKCLRTDDIYEVGDSSHLTYFEMLGNWSLGDYFKKESLAFSWEFLTDPEKGLGIDPKRIYVTIFAGNDTVSRDDESVEIWKGLFASAGLTAELDTPLAEGGRIFTDATNWWGPAGATGPCGPDSEIYIDTEIGELTLPNGMPDFEGTRLVEVWNNVFMQFDKAVDGTYAKLVQHNVDTGMGLERISAVMQGVPTVFDTDLFVPIRQSLIEQVPAMAAQETAQRIVADHLRASVFLIADGVVPSNKDRGYILRRLIRRAIMHASHDTVEWLAPVIATITQQYQEEYPELSKGSGDIHRILLDEARRFQKTLAKGKAEIEKQETLTGKVAFDLYQSYGFPLELTKEYAESKGITINEAEFATEFQQHQQLSRTANAGQFSSGLADTSEQTVKYHTATHLLHEALRRILGDHVQQKGSNLTPERLRFDFTNPEKLTAQQLAAVEEEVNAQIAAALPVSVETLSPAEARLQGAIGLFGDKYGDLVTVYAIGNFSKEICTGPHVSNTNELGHFKIQKEEAVAQGIRRIKAILE